MFAIDGLAAIMYPQEMERPSARSWDWLSAGLLFLLIQVTAGRLVLTEWTSFLYFTETLAALGAALGLALGYSRSNSVTVVLRAMDQTMFILPWQGTPVR